MLYSGLFHFLCRKIRKPPLCFLKRRKDCDMLTGRKLYKIYFIPLGRIYRYRLLSPTRQEHSLPVAGTVLFSSVTKKELSSGNLSATKPPSPLFAGKKTNSSQAVMTTHYACGIFRTKKSNLPSSKPIRTGSVPFIYARTGNTFSWETKKAYCKKSPSPDHMAAAIRQELQRDFTREEWDYYIGNQIPFDLTA